MLADTRKKVLDEIISLANDALEITNTTATRLSGQLAPVMRIEDEADTDAKDKDFTQYPPAFDELRSSLFKIRDRIGDMNEVINRVEI